MVPVSMGYHLHSSNLATSSAICIIIVNYCTHCDKRHLASSATTATSCDVPHWDRGVGVEYAQQRRYVFGETRGAPLAVHTVFISMFLFFCMIPMTRTLFLSVLCELPVEAISAIKINLKITQICVSDLITYYWELAL